MDDVLVGNSGLVTRWNNLVLRKLNILMWRIARDRLPTRLNLRDKGIDLDSLSRGCDGVGESTNHLFVECTTFVNIWHRIAINVVGGGHPF